MGQSSSRPETHQRTNEKESLSSWLAWEVRGRPPSEPPEEPAPPTPSFQTSGLPNSEKTRFHDFEHAACGDLGRQPRKLTEKPAEAD